MPFFDPPTDDSRDASSSKRKRRVKSFEDVSDDDDDFVISTVSGGGGGGGSSGSSGGRARPERERAPPSSSKCGEVASTENTTPTEHGIDQSGGRGDAPKQNERNGAAVPSRVPTGDRSIGETGPTTSKRHRHSHV